MIQPAATGFQGPFLLVTDSCERGHPIHQLLYPLLEQTTLHRGEVGSLAVLAVQAQEGRNACPAIHLDVPAHVSVSYQESQGRPVTEAVNCAQTLRTGLVAVACRDTDRGREARLRRIPAALGFTITQGIARHAPCPVLLAANPSPEHHTHTQWERVLLVVSGSAASRQAIAITQQLMAVGIQHLTLLSVVPLLHSYHWYGPFAPPPPTWQFNQFLQQLHYEQRQVLLHQVATTLTAPNLTLQPLILTGEAGPLICQVAQQQQADVVVLGSDVAQSMAQMQSVLRPGRLTATAEFVIQHSPCAVLLCRTPQPAVPQRTPYLTRLKLYATGIPGTR